MKGVLKSFLLPAAYYADDVADIVGNCVQRHGEEEWRAVVLTNEIHGHLGIYSTLGAKMGILARELFREKGLEGDISVLSFAGNVPPVSCLNDGLQVSTGASMGHGLFAVSPRDSVSVKASFRCGNAAREISLLPDYEALLKADLQKGVALYGHSAAYWNHVRRLALAYWAGWDRSEIFLVRWSGLPDEA